MPASAREAAFALLPGWRTFRCQGRDAVDLLSRLSTNDLAPLGRGEAVTTIFLTPTGRIRHRVVLAPPPREEPGLGLLALVEGDAPAFPAWIDTYTFAEDCRVVSAPLAAMQALGPGALGRAPGPLERTGAVARDARCTWMRRDWGGVPAALVVGAMDDVHAEARDSGLPALDETALLQLRVECGEPAAGHELTEERFPLEAGLLAEISFTKGCYTGQEVVARQDSYGKVTRRLVGLALDRPPIQGEELPAEGRGCAVTSVAPSSARTRDGRLVRIALGFVSSRSAAPGSVVETRSGLRAEVCELPFLPA